ncbi:MAG: GNAT family N-acetyltransferase [Parcubacteria group bacterium]|jgi:GNAT superfamily N-acetyltransferase
MELNSFNSYEHPVIIEKDSEQILFEERELFVRKNYPMQDSHYQLEELINSGLDGMEVIEKRDAEGEILGMISYDIGEDQNGIAYLSIGIILTDQEARGEGLMDELFAELVSIAKTNDCDYVVAIADTDEGVDFFSDRGFEEQIDEVNSREHFRLDL